MPLPRTRLKELAFRDGRIAVDVLDEDDLAVISIGDPEEEWIRLAPHEAIRLIEVLARAVRRAGAAEHNRDRPPRGAVRRHVDDGGIVPRVGDLARVLAKQTFESGATLRPNQNVQVTNVSDEPGSLVGVRWADREGCHAAAIRRADLEVLP